VRMLASLLRWELLINARQGIWMAAVFVLVFWSIALSLVPAPAKVLVTAALLFVEVGVFALYLLPASYYLEKGQRILDGLITTPLQPSLWLAAKTTVFMLQAIVVSIVITLFALGWETVHWGWFLVAVLLLALPQLLFAFVLATRYHGISEFLFPSIPVMFLLQIPLLGYLDVLTGPFWWIFPTFPGLALLDLSLSGGGPEQPWLAALWGLAYGTVPVWLWAAHRLKVTATRQAGT